MFLSKKRDLEWRKKNHFKTMNDWQTKKKYVDEFLNAIGFIGLVFILASLMRFL